MDQSPDAEPDIVASACFFPFIDHCVDLIYCDPPHMIGRKRELEKPVMSPWFASVNRAKYPHQHFLNCIGRFSSWISREQWITFLEMTNQEFHRVLKPSGLLEYKLCTMKTRSVAIEDLDIMSKFRKTGTPKLRTSPLGKNPVYYVTMKPIDGRPSK